MNRDKESGHKKHKRQKKKQFDQALIKAAQVLVDDDVDLMELPNSPEKEEFLELAEQALHDKINSLSKARLEYLCTEINSQYEKYKNREEIEKRRAESQALRAKREKERKMIKMKTKKGQPILKNLAKVQYRQVREMIERENREGK